jgi:DNA-binding transcriptional MerR regulator
MQIGTIAKKIGHSIDAIRFYERNRRIIVSKKVVVYSQLG